MVRDATRRGQSQFCVAKNGGNRVVAKKSIVGAAQPSRKRLGRPPQSAGDLNARKDLLDAALKLFAERGYARTSNKEIASAAGKNAALIYYYFKSKDDLFVATLAEAAEHALSRSRELIAESAGPVDLLKSWFQSHRQMKQEISFLMKIMIDHRFEPKKSARRVDDIISAFYREETEQLLGAAISEGVAAGTFRTVDVVATALFVSVHLDGILVSSMVRSAFNYEAALDDLEARVFDMLCYEADFQTK